MREAQKKVKKAGGKVKKRAKNLRQNFGQNLKSAEADQILPAKSKNFVKNLAKFWPLPRSKSEISQILSLEMGQNLSSDQTLCTFKNASF